MRYALPKHAIPVALALGAAACSVYDASLLTGDPRTAGGGASASSTSNGGGSGGATTSSTSSGGSGGASASSKSSGGSGGASANTSSTSGGGSGGASASTSSTSGGGSGGASTTSTSSGGSGGASTTSTSSGGSGGASTTSTSNGGSGGATTSSTSSGGSGGATTSSTSSGGSGGASTSSTSSGCSAPSDCPGSDDECKTRSCASGGCGFEYTSQGTPSASQTLGDCKRLQCDGVGGTEATADDQDVPSAGSVCVMASCEQSLPKFTPVSAREPCNEDGGTLCDGAGACVACLIGGDCGSGLCVAGRCVPPLVISEIRTRGVGGGEDEFIELYNPTDAPVILDGGWQVRSRSNIGSTYGTSKWSGTGQVLPPHGHFLIVGTAYANEATAPHDATLATGLTDPGSFVLEYGNPPEVVDAVCLYTIPSTRLTLLDPAKQYVCEGEPAHNSKHKDSTPASNVDASLERKPGGGLGNGADTDDSLADFLGAEPSNPQGLQSPPTPP